jgi:hypothetical protein
MSTNKIFTFGDGYATGHIWPEWPQILDALLPDYEILNSSRVGAGPEWLVNQFVSKIPHIQDSTVIFQWPQANRFDKLIEDTAWQNTADTDPVYAFNQYESWWLSSASTQQPVIEYHTKFVQPKQHASRLDTYKILVEQTLKNNQCCYLFITTKDQQNFASQTRFKKTRQTEVQPSPVVHLAYINDVILPQLPGIKVDVSRYQEISNRISRHKWVAYDPDRAEIWNKMAAI